MIDAASAAAPVTSPTAELGNGLTIASVVGVVGGGFLANSGGSGRVTARRRQAANDSGGAGGLSPRVSSIGAAAAAAAGSTAPPVRAGVTGGGGGAGSRVRPLGQWNRRWPANAGQSRRTSGDVGGGSRLTTRLEESPTSGRTASWQAAPLPFGLVQSRPKTSTTTLPAAGADTQKLQRRQSSGATAAAGAATGSQTKRKADTEGVQTLPMQLIDVRLELPQWSTPRQRRLFPSASSGSTAGSATARGSAAPGAGQAKLSRVQLGDGGGSNAASDFAGAAAARARRLHPMLDARKRRCEELVRSTYLLASGRRTLATSSLSSSMASLMSATRDDADAVIGGIEADDVYSSGLRSRVRSAYFSAAAPFTSPPSTPPQLLPPPPLQPADVDEFGGSSRQPWTSPASGGSACSSAGSQRTLRSPSPTQQPPPNTAESCNRIRLQIGAGQDRQNSWRDVHIAY